VSGSSSQPPAWGPPLQPGSGPSSSESTEPMAELPAAHQPLALPAPAAGELALPPGSAPALLPPASSSSAPSAAPPSKVPAQPGEQATRWASRILALAVTLLVVCMLPLWVFGIWSIWYTNSHAPPPVLAVLNPGGQRADDARWSPDGRYLAEQFTLDGSPPGNPNGVAVALWDVAGQREIRLFTGADGGLAAAWSPDGSVLATTDGTHVLLWPVQQIEVPGANVAPVAGLSAHDPNEKISDLAWAKDGQTLAVADEGGLDIWTRVGAAWKQQQYFPDSSCATLLCNRHLSWSPDGTWLLVAPWHTAAGQSGVGTLNTQTWKSGPLIDASAPLAWSPDGSLVLLRARDDTTLMAAQAGSWKTAWTINPNLDLHQNDAVYPDAAGWSPDGRWLVGTADGWVDLWPTDTRRSVWVWNEQHISQGIYGVNSLSWSPDSHTLAVTTDGTARLILYDMRDPSPPGSGPPAL